MAKSIEQLKKEAARLQELIAFREASESKIVEYVAQMKAAIREAGFEVTDVAKLLIGPKPRAARGTATPRNKSESEDSTGAKPERGATYKHSSWPEPWTAQGKRAPKHVVASIKSGKNWKSLVAR